MKISALLLSILLLTSGCATSRSWDSTFSKILIPVNATIGYFGSVALHEGGHAITADTLGARHIKVSILPTKDRNGNFHLGLTSIEHRFSDTELSLFGVMGPTAQFLGYVGSRELLKSDKIPRLLQPTIAWFGLMNQIGFYYHTVNGLIRNKKKDLGKEDLWISGVMLGAGILYEIYDFFLAEKPIKKFQVLFGEDFYEPEPKEYSRFKVVSRPLPGGGLFGISCDF